MTDSISTIRHALEDYEDSVSDLLSSNYQTFGTNLSLFISILDAVEPFESVVQELPEVDFKQWYEAAIGTVQGMVGSGTLDWPNEPKEYLALRVALLRHINDGAEDVPNFCSKFMYAGKYLDDMIHEFGNQIVEPTARDLQKLAERSIPDGNTMSKSPPTLEKAPWYQRPIGMVVLGIVIAVLGGLVLSLLG